MVDGVGILDIIADISFILRSLTTNSHSLNLNTPSCSIQRHKNCSPYYITILSSYKGLAYALQYCSSLNLNRYSLEYIFIEYFKASNND